MAALREIIQNGMDAVRLHQLVDPNAPEPMIEVTTSSEGCETTITIRDNGVGMSESSIVENLLSFGTSGWLGDTAIGEYNNEYPKSTSLSGKYGIGFFSIFMLGTAVEIKSRRFDASPDETIILSFPEGLNSRPIICGAQFTERMTVGGTEIRVKLDRAKLERGRGHSRRNKKFWSDDKEGHKALIDAVSTEFPASSVPVKILYSEGSYLIDGRYWETEPASELFKRVEGSYYPSNTNILFEDAVRLIKEDDGTVVGRGVLYPDRLSGYANLSSDARVQGVVVAKGTRVCDMGIRGVLLGEPIRASRDQAVALASPQALKSWATQQGTLLQEVVTEDQDQVSIAEMVAVLGGDIGDLKFCEVGGQFLNVKQLRSLLRERDEIWVAFNAGVSLAQPKNIASVRTDTCISVHCGWRGLIPDLIQPEASMCISEYGHELESFAEQVICDEFGISDEVLKKVNLIENGCEVYSVEVAAWKTSEGETAFTSGSYYKRNLTIEDVDQFFVPESQRDVS